MKKFGKKYRAVLEKFNVNEYYSLDKAVSILPETSITKFASSAEIHMNLSLDPKQADQNIRGTVALPHGTGKEVRVVAFVSEDKVKEAKSAGAIEAGKEELIDKVLKGWTEFDVAIATPDVMKDLGKIAKILGQKGLMPNPKAGTITSDIKTTVETIKKGQIEYRNDKLCNLHNGFGKINFTKEQLLENVKAYIKAIIDAKPATVKGTYINTITLATTMGPGIKVDVNGVLKEVK
ncbi:MAG: 50S ribosomal protein L1, large subunit ribosomal protein L1 [Candidatus Peregrinibacteria bacterium GW2011_GWC2_33_13]|nr:MAG: 50S ribosomal protein L1, large subunit ribosomal protein L1 [Candidatus Peregrinibacteria bacterium GW2011_GWC2_33_13]